MHILPPVRRTKTSFFRLIWVIFLSGCLATTVKETIGLGVDGVKFRVHSKHAQQKFALLHELVRETSQRQEYWMAAINQSAKEFSKSISRMDRQIERLREDSTTTDREIEMLIANFQKHKEEEH